MKVRIGIGAGGDDLGPEAMVALGRGHPGRGFDSLVAARGAHAARARPAGRAGLGVGRLPGLKIGTTMLLPGRNLVWLAKAVATLDELSGGRFLLTFVPGLGIGGERSAIGIPTRGARRADGGRAARAAAALGRRGRSATTARPAPSPTSRCRPGLSRSPSTSGSAATSPAALERCGRLADGWLPAFCTPEDAAGGQGG